MRRRILELAEGERDSGEVTTVVRDEFGISRPAVSQHLRVLREHAFTTVRADGTRRLYAVDPAPLREIDGWLERYRRMWSQPLDAVATEASGSAAGTTPMTPRGRTPSRRLTPERLARFFMRPTGDLREGGTFQLEGNAGGQIRGAHKGGSQTEAMIARQLASKPDHAVALYDRFVELVNTAGPVTQMASPTTIGFKGQRRAFAGVQVANDGLAVFLDLRHEMNHPRVTDIVPHNGPLFSHQIRLTTLDDFNDEFATWVENAHEVGHHGIR